MTKHVMSKSTKQQGQKGGGLRVAPRLKGVVKNKGIKPVKRKKALPTEPPSKSRYWGNNLNFFSPTKPPLSF